MTFWFIGMSGAGKTTMGTLLEDYLRACGLKCCRIDGDEVRKFFNNNIGYSKAEREHNMKRITLSTYFLDKSGVVTIVCAMMSFELWREFARSKIEGYHEIYMKASIERLVKNDVKGVYSQYLGKQCVVGVDMPWDVPLNSDLIIDTDVETVDESFLKVKKFVDSIIAEGSVTNK